MRSKYSSLEIENSCFGPKMQQNVKKSASAFGLGEFLSSVYLRVSKGPMPLFFPPQPSQGCSGADWTKLRHSWTISEAHSDQLDACWRTISGNWLLLGSFGALLRSIAEVGYILFDLRPVKRVGIRGPPMGLNRRPMALQWPPIGLRKLPMASNRP